MSLDITNSSGYEEEYDVESDSDLNTDEEAERRSREGFEEHEEAGRLTPMEGPQSSTTVTPRELRRMARHKSRNKPRSASRKATLPRQGKETAPPEAKFTRRRAPAEPTTTDPQPDQEQKRSRSSGPAIPRRRSTLRAPLSTSRSMSRKKTRNKRTSASSEESTSTRKAKFTRAMGLRRRTNHQPEPTTIVAPQPEQEQKRSRSSGPAIPTPRSTLVKAPLSQQGEESSSSGPPLSTSSEEEAADSTLLVKAPLLQQEEERSSSSGPPLSTSSEEEAADSTLLVKAPLLQQEQERSSSSGPLSTSSEEEAANSTLVKAPLLQQEEERSSSSGPLSTSSEEEAANSTLVKASLLQQEEERSSSSGPLSTSSEEEAAKSTLVKGSLLQQEEERSSSSGPLSTSSEEEAATSTLVKGSLLQQEEERSSSSGPLSTSSEEEAANSTLAKAPLLQQDEERSSSSGPLSTSSEEESSSGSPLTRSKEDGQQTTGERKEDQSSQEEQLTSTPPDAMVHGDSPPFEAPAPRTTPSTEGQRDDQSSQEDQSTLAPPEEEEEEDEVTVYVTVVDEVGPPEPEPPISPPPRGPLMLKVGNRWVWNNNKNRHPAPAPAKSTMEVRQDLYLSDEDDTWRPSEENAEEASADETSFSDFLPRRPSPKRRPQTSGRKPQRPCGYPDCEAHCVNLAGHYRQVHGGVAPDTGKKPPRVLKTRGCPLCGVTTVRLDLHLVRQHGMERRGKTFKEAMESAEEVGDTAGQRNLATALDSYAQHLQDRAAGGRTLGTASSHITAVKTFLNTLTIAALVNLRTIGQKGGAIDAMLAKGKHGASTLKLYVTNLCHFLRFVAGEAALVQKLGASTQELAITRDKLLGVAQSLKGDVNRQAVEAAGQHPEGYLAVEPWMAGGYLTSPDVMDAQSLLASSPLRPLQPREMTACRNSLVLRILLTNFKRAGDVSNMMTEAVVRAKIDEDEEKAEIFVITHKEAVSGKRCPVFVDGELLEDLRLYAAYVAKPNEEGLLFTTFQGGRISPSNMAKIVETTWAAYGRRAGWQLPKLTSSISRKLAVTTHRETDPSREVQTALAAHMAHDVGTADRYYNKAGRKRARTEATDTIVTQYKEAIAKKVKSESPARPATPGTPATPGRFRGTVSESPMSSPATPATPPTSATPAMPRRR